MILCAKVFVADVNYVRVVMARSGWGGHSYNGLYGEAPPERGTFFILEVHKRVGILRVEV